MRPEASQITAPSHPEGPSEGHGPRHPDIRIRLVLAPGQMIGPGKAELLERIARTGSIAAAGREMGMSYKRAWQLVETLNSMFDDPLVLSSRGGASGGGASVTETGQAVLHAYRAFCAEAAAAGAGPLQQLQDLRRSRALAEGQDTPGTPPKV